MESILIIDCSVKDIDFLIKAVDRKKTYVVVTANDVGIGELLGQLRNLNATSVTNAAWVYGDNSVVEAFVAKAEIVKVLDMLKGRSDRFVGIHMVNIGAGEAPRLCPWRFFDRVGVKVTMSRNLNGHLIQPTPVFERVKYFTDLVETTSRWCRWTSPRTSASRPASSTWTSSAAPVTPRSWSSWSTTC